MTEKSPVDFVDIRRVLNEAANNRMLKNQISSDYVSADDRMQAIDLYTRIATALVEVDRRIEELDEGRKPQTLPASVLKQGR